MIAKIGEYQSALKKVAAEQFLASVPTIEETGYKPDYLPESTPTPGAVSSGDVKPYAGPTPSLATGTPYVQKSGWAKVHKGEAVFPANVNPFTKSTPSNIFNNQRNSESNTYAPVVNVVVQGNGDKWEIKKGVKEALDESAVQYGRRGSWVMPGG